MQSLGKDVDLVIEGFVLGKSIRGRSFVTVSGVFNTIFFVSRESDDRGEIEVDTPNFLIIKGRNLHIDDYSPQSVVISGDITELKPYRVEGSIKTLLDWKIVGGEQ